MSYKHNKSWRKRNPEKRNGQRKRYYQKSQHASNGMKRWKTWEKDFILCSFTTDTLQSCSLRRSVQAIQTMRHRLWKMA